MTSGARTRAAAAICGVRRGGGGERTLYPGGRAPRRFGGNNRTANMPGGSERERPQGYPRHVRRHTEKWALSVRNITFWDKIRT